MREIKFRAWDGRNECYFEISEFSNDKGEIYGALDGQTVVESEHLILEQYTGVKDEHGFEIYEGDILIDSDNGCVYGVVEFTDGEFSADGYRLYDEAASTYVGGNIHENTELLEGE